MMKIRKINHKMVVAALAGIWVMVFFFAGDIIFFQSSGRQAMVSPSFRGDSDSSISFGGEKILVSDVVLGDGETAVFGSNLVVSYNGWFEGSKKIFVSFPKESPLAFTLGRGDVISGWEEGLVGMKEGGIRRLVIPSDRGYGRFGLRDFSGKTLVPPNTALVFEVFLLSVSN